MVEQQKEDPTAALAERLTRLAGEEYCYVTTTGRVSGKPHKIEIWFGARGNTLYLLSGGGTHSDWVKNMRVTPQVTVMIARQTFNGLARRVTEEVEVESARKLLAGKYQQWREGRALSDWARTSLPVAIDLTAETP